MVRKPKSFEEAMSSTEFSTEDYCGTSYAAKLLGLSVATVQSLVEKGEIEAWKTLGGHRRIALKSISAYLTKAGPQSTRVVFDPSSRLRVLVVEDDLDMLELYKCHFENWDLPVDCTWMTSALEALMDIASMQPDLLITDLSMPGLDGLEMLRVLERNQNLTGLQILVISGLETAAITARGGLPLNAHRIKKPVNFDWLEGYVTALVTANSQWHNRKQPDAGFAVGNSTAASVRKLFNETSGVEDANI
jgi:excisionase family DNA binding protein